MGDDVSSQSRKMYFEVLDSKSRDSLKNHDSLRKRVRTPEDEHQDVKDWRAQKRARTEPRTQKPAPNRQSAGLKNTKHVKRIHFWQALDHACSSRNRHMASAEYKNSAQTLQILNKFDEIVGIIASIPIIKTPHYEVRTSALFGGTELVVRHKKPKNAQGQAAQDKSEYSIFQNEELSGKAARWLMSITKEAIEQRLGMLKNPRHHLEYIFAIVSAMVKFTPVWHDMIDSINALPVDGTLKMGASIDFSDAQYHRCMRKNTFDPALVLDDPTLEKDDAQGPYGTYTVVVGS